MKKLLLVALTVLSISVPARADYMIVVEGWNKDFIAFKLAYWHKERIQVKLINLPGVGKTLVFKS